MATTGARIIASGGIRTIGALIAAAGSSAVGASRAPSMCLLLPGSRLFQIGSTLVSDLGLNTSPLLSAALRSRGSLRWP